MRIINEHIKVKGLNLSILLLVLPLTAAGAQEVSVSGDVPAKVTLSLQECRDLSLQNDVYVRNAELDVLAARAQKQEALAEYFPKVAITAFGFYSLDPMLELGLKDVLGESDFTGRLQEVVDKIAPELGINTKYSALQYGYMATVSVMQPVYAGGRIVNGNRLAKLGMEAAGLQKSMKLRENAESVEASYWQVVSLEEKMLTLNQLSGLIDNLYKDVSTACAAGLATDADLLQVQLKRNEIKSGMIQVRNGIRLSKMNLFNSIGMDYSVVKGLGNEARPYIDDIELTDRIEDMQSPDECYVPEEEIALNLDEARLLDLSVKAKQLEKKMTLGEALPQVAVGASYGYSDMVNRKFNGNVYAMVQIPISDWGKISRRMQRQEYQIQKAANERDFLSSQLLLQVRQLWMNLTATWEQVAVARESMDVAQKTVDQLVSHYQAGMITLSELLQAQTSLRQASDAYIDKCIAYRTALVEYQGRVNVKKGE